MSNVVKPYLIAEIGINHNGDIEIAKKLINEAKAAKFDAVKFQKETLICLFKNFRHPKKSPWGTTTREQKIGLEFEKEYDQINEYCTR